MKNGKYAGIGRRVRANADESLYLPADADPAVRQFILYEAITNFIVPQGARLVAGEKALARLEEVREQQARATSRAYGPDHPQSWESLYSPEAKLLREFGI